MFLMLDRTREAIQFKGQYAAAHLSQLSSRVNRARTRHSTFPRRTTRFNTSDTFSSRIRPHGQAEHARDVKRAFRRHSAPNVEYRETDFADAIAQTQGRAPTSGRIKISARLSLVSARKYYCFFEH